jgi:plasmid replication initiation protein
MTGKKNASKTSSDDSRPGAPQESVVLLNKDEVVPISTQTDMMVPVSFAMMKHDFSKIQIRAIINIIKKLQVDLKKLFSMGSRRAIINSRDSSLSLVFNDSESVEVSPGKYDIVFKMNELSSNARNYYDLEQSLIHMADIPVQMPVKIKGRDVGESEDYIDFTRYTHLCDVSISDKRYKRIVIFSFTPEVAEKFISTDFGYLKLYDSVIMKSGNRYTQLMYMLLSQFRDKEYIRIRTSKLRDRLNISDKYKEFRKVRRCVLDVAQENLSKMFEEGESDISFTYECEYKGTPVRGQEPDYIKFHIIKRLLVSKEDYEDRVRYSKNMVDIFTERRNVLFEGLSKINMFNVNAPEATFYMMVDISKTRMKSIDFCYALLRAVHVAVVPGVTYGQSCDHYIRIAFTLNVDKIQEGIKRITEFANSL